jgi:putative transposase
MHVINGHPGIAVSRRCKLLGLARSSLYYRARGESTYNDKLMRLLDEQYMKTPFYGVRRMTEWLRVHGQPVNHKRVWRLMHLMGIAAIYPRPRLSIGGAENRRYPYLLSGLKVAHPNQVWCTDITYIRLRRGFVYLTAIMDWFSRYVLAWAVSITLDARFCVSALEQALRVATPEIFNSDQGAQFTSREFTDRLLQAGIRISMDGQGRVFDNIFVERLWRTIKYEEVYLNDYQTVSDATRRLGSYLHFYNDERLHQSLGYKTPSQVYYEQGGSNEALQANKEHWITGGTMTDALHLKQPVLVS